MCTLSDRASKLQIKPENDVKPKEAFFSSSFVCRTHTHTHPSSSSALLPSAPVSQCSPVVFLLLSIHPSLSGKSKASTNGTNWAEKHKLLFVFCRCHYYLCCRRCLGHRSVLPFRTWSIRVCSPCDVSCLRVERVDAYGSVAAVLSLWCDNAVQSRPKGCLPCRQKHTHTRVNNVRTHEREKVRMNSY